MVAPALPTGFYSGQPVRLLVGFLGWTARGGRRFLAGGDTPPDNCRFLSPAEPLRFYGSRSTVPGSCYVQDARGVVYPCPLDFIALADAQVMAGAVA